MPVHLCAVSAADAVAPLCLCSLMSDETMPLHCFCALTSVMHQQIRHVPKHRDCVLADPLYSSRPLKGGRCYRACSLLDDAFTMCIADTPQFYLSIHISHSCLLGSCVFPYHSVATITGCTTGPSASRPCPAWQPPGCVWWQSWPALQTTWACASPVHATCWGQLGWGQCWQQ